MTESTAEGLRPPRRLWVAAGWQLVARVWSAGCTVAALAVLARTMEPDAFGRFIFWVAAFLAIESAVDLGTGAVAMQRTAGRPELLPGVLASTRRIRGGAALVAMSAFAIAAFASGDRDALWIVAASAYYLTWPLELTPTVLKNKLAYGTIAIARVLAATLRVGGVVALSLFDVTHVGPMLVAFTASAGIANVWVHRRTLRYLPAAVGAVRAARGVLREAWPLGLAALCQQTYFYVDNVFVRSFHGDEAVGRYGACVRLMSFSILGAQYVAASALPWLVRRAPEGRLALAATGLALPLVLLAAPVYGVVSAHSEGILRLVFGADFASAAPALVWLFAAGAAVHAGAVLHTALVASGARRAALVVAASALALNALANAWAVPRFGIQGAAATTLATEVWVVVGSGWLLLRTDRAALSSRLWLALLAPPLFLLGALVGGYFEGA